MKRSILILTLFILLILSCDNSHLNKQDIVGVWTSDDGASFQFNKDGKFYAANLPPVSSYFPKDQLGNQKFSGAGKWVIDTSEDPWKIDLSYNNSANLKGGYDTEIEISGKSVLLGNNPYLFTWVDNKGDLRYIFKKTINK